MSAQKRYLNFISKNPDKYSNTLVNKNNMENVKFDLICDPIGFRQHAGECWIDTIQQLMLFGDGFKEVSQPFFSKLTEKKTKETITEYIIEKHNVNQKPEKIYNAYSDVEKLSNKLSNGLLHIKKRFINKYKTLKNIPKENFDTCLNITDPIIRLESVLSNQSTNTSKLRRTTSAYHAIHIAENIHTIASDRLRTGLTIEETEKVLDFFLSILKLKSKYKTILTSYVNKTLSYREKFSNLYDFELQMINAPLFFKAVMTSGKMFHVGMVKVLKNGYDFLTSSNNELSRAYQDFRSGHISCFYQCNEQLLYYDDNFGIYPVHNEMFDYLSEIDGVLYSKSGNILFVRMGWLGNLNDHNVLSSRQDGKVFYEGRMQSFHSAKHLFDKVHFHGFLQITDKLYICEDESYKPNINTINNNNTTKNASSGGAKPHRYTRHVFRKH